MARDWGDERPALTKRYVNAVDRHLEASLDLSGRAALGHALKSLGYVSAVPAVVIGSAVGVDDTAAAIGPRFVALAVDNGLVVATASAVMSVIGVALGVVVSDMIRETDDAGIHRRLTTSVSRIRTASTVVASGGALAAVGVDVANAMHAIATPVLVSVLDNTTAGAAAVLLTAIGGSKLIRAISPRPWGGLSE